MSDTDGFDPNTLALAPYSYNNYQQQQQQQLRLPPAFNTDTPSIQVNPPLSPNSTAAAAAAFNLDPSLLQTTIGSLLQSPAAAQMFLNSLNSSSQAHSLSNSNPNPNSNYLNHAPQFNNNSHAVNQQYPFPNSDPNLHTNNYNNIINNNIDPSSHPSVNSNIDPTLALFSPIPNQVLQGNNEALLRSYQDALNVGGDMDRLQEGIDSLVRSMGLDLPATGHGQGQGQGQGDAVYNGGLDMGVGAGAANGAEEGNGNVLNGLGEGNDSLNLDMGDADFDVDQFLESLGRDDEHVDLTGLH